MTSKKSVALAVAVTVLAALSGCGSDSKDVATGTKPDKAAFCRTGRQIDAATADIRSNDDAVAAFAKVEDKVHLAVSQAPNDIASDMKFVAAAIDKGLKTKDFSAFQDGSLDKHTSAIDAYC